MKIKYLMKKLFLFCLLIIFVPISVYSQLDQWSFQLSVGISEPRKDLKGEIYRDDFYNGMPVTYISDDFISNNYGAKTGFSFIGSAKINFDKYNIFRAIASLSYDNFNSFTGDRSTNTTIQYYNNQGQLTTTTTPVTYSYHFNNFGIGIGLEVAPLSFTKIVSPFFSAKGKFNFLSAGLVRTLSASDSLKANFSSFRIGAELNAGLEFKINQNFGFVAGINYNFANLLLKNTQTSLASAVGFGRDNLEINDAEGWYFNSLSNPIYNNIPYQKYSRNKDIQYWTIYLGVNFYLDQPGKNKKK